MSAPQPAAGAPRARLLLDATCRDAFAAALARCTAARAAARIWAGDHTLWQPAPAEVANRLGWLRAPADMMRELPRIAAFARGVRAEGIREALLLGMGGSSLAPELFTATFGAAPGHPPVAVLDSTDPVAVRAAAARHPPDSSLYVVSTKSGGTVETLSFFKYFHAAAAARLGAAAAGRRFVIVTDPGSSLEEMGRRIGAREVFLNDPDVGGRFSALTHFGLVPAALDGVNLERLLASAQAMAARCAAGVADTNPGVALGALAGAMALIGRDKLTIVCSERIAGFGAWVEQLVAESTGKQGRGIVPVTGERPATPGQYRPERLFVFLLLDGDRDHDGVPDALAAAGHPVLELRIADRLELGGEFFRWEFATAVAGHLLGVNPFDQPDVEAAKREARAVIAAYRERGALPVAASEVDAGAAPAQIMRLLAAAQPGDFVGLQAFVDPGGAAAALEELGAAVRARTGRAVTAGFGPRFLHSTGQLHKGGPGGVFIQLVSANADDETIPDDFGSGAGSIGFGVLKSAQSIGDLRALEAVGRRVLRVCVGEEGPGVAAALRSLAGAVAPPA
ncbi:MAG TPA: glucose-6-phosphate isomerase [bacterium]